MDRPMPASWLLLIVFASLGGCMVAQLQSGLTVDSFLGQGGRSLNPPPEDLRTVIRQPEVLAPEQVDPQAEVRPWHVPEVLVFPEWRQMYPDNIRIYLTDASLEDVTKFYMDKLPESWLIEQHPDRHVVVRNDGLEIDIESNGDRRKIVFTPLMLNDDFTFLGLRRDAPPLGIPPELHYPGLTPVEGDHRAFTTSDTPQQILVWYATRLENERAEYDESEPDETTLIGPGFALLLRKTAEGATVRVLPPAEAESNA